MRKAIFLNGPPRSGKDTITEELRQEFFSLNLHNEFGDKLPQVVHEKFSRPLKVGVQAIYGVGEDAESHKDTITEDFLEQSYRTAQIQLFNHLMRLHTSTVLGRLFDRRVRRYTGDSIFIVSDTGRFDEVFPAIASFKPEDCVLFRIHRQHTSFAGDIRQYVVDSEIYGVKAFDVDNNSTIHDAASRILNILKDVWGGYDTWTTK